MSEHASQPQADPGQQAADAHYYRHALHGLIDLGSDLARLLHGQATAHAAHQAAPPLAPTGQATDAQPTPTPATLVTIAAAFDKVARTVRRCIMLAQRLAQPVPPAPDPARQRIAARKRILRDVEDAIQRTLDGVERPDAEALQAELRERLDAPDLEWDLATRSLPEIIAEICRDLGLAAHPGTRPWKRRTPQDLADLYIRATAPSRPHPPSPAPHAPRCGGTPKHPAAPAAATPDASAPAATSASRQAHTRSGDDPPADPADLVAAILRHPTQHQDRWHPPPSG